MDPIDSQAYAVSVVRVGCQGDQQRIPRSEIGQFLAKVFDRRGILLYIVAAHLHRHSPVCTVSQIQRYVDREFFDEVRVLLMDGTLVPYQRRVF